MWSPWGSDPIRAGPSSAPTSDLWLPCPAPAAAFSPSATTSSRPACSSVPACRTPARPATPGCPARAWRPTRRSAAPGAPAATGETPPAGCAVSWGWPRGGPGLLGPPDTVSAPRAPLPTQEGVQAVRPRAACVLRLPVSAGHLWVPFPHRTSHLGPRGRPGQPTNPIQARCPASPWMPVHRGAGPRTASSPHRTQSPESTGLAEGCFCPDGQTLFNSHTDVCVPECRKHTPALAPDPVLVRQSGGAQAGRPCPASMSMAASAQCQPVCRQPRGLEPLVPRGFHSQGDDRGWGVARPGRTCPCGLWPLPPAVNPRTPRDPLSPSLPACVGPDGFPKYVSGSAPSRPHLAHLSLGGRALCQGWCGRLGVHASLSQGCSEMGLGTRATLAKPRLGLSSQGP